MEANELENKDIKGILEKSNEGNELLYKFCSEVDRLADIRYLSPQIWLIGRSYAASPQRRSYKADENGKKPDISDKGDGTDAFFDKLADKLVKNEEYKKLIGEIEKLKTVKYDYKNSDNDKDILNRTARSVITFNKILREAIKSIDNTKNDTLTNFVSFSSKFLHFYVPQAVFIIDSISDETLRDAFNKYSELALIDKNDKDKYTKISDDLIKNFGYEFTNDREKENGLKYIKHCCRAYVLACKFHNKEEFKKIIKPRAVDNYLLYYLSPEINNAKSTEKSMATGG